MFLECLEMVDYYVDRESTQVVQATSIPPELVSNTNCTVTYYYYYYFKLTCLSCHNLRKNIFTKMTTELA